MAASDKPLGPDSSATRLAQVAKLTEAVSRAKSVAEIHELALSCLEQTLGADRTSVLLFDETGVMRFVAWHGLSESYRAAVDGHSPWTPTESNPRPILVPDAEADPSLVALLPVFRAEKIRALGFVPLRAGGKLIGKFMLYYRAPHSFAPDDVILAEIVAGHVAFAVERRRKDAELERAHSELDAILHSVSDGLAVSRADGALLFANDAAAEMLGFSSREELLAMPPAEVLARFELYHDHGRSMSASELPARRATDERQAVTELVGFRKRDGGATRWALMTSTPLIRDDGVLAVNVFRDVTAQRETEEALRRSERQMRDAYAAAREAEARKDEFLAILGHELRNPLAPIVTALQLMKLKGQSEFARERTIIDRQVQHLLRLVDDLLDISRITRGKLELKRQPIGLSAIVTKAIELADPLLDERHHQLAVEVPDALVVSADPQRLTQVVANLLTNAAQNTPEQGHIRVKGTRSGDAIELAVIDDGVGIEAELLPRLFDQFVQGQQTLGREKGGLGLGLAIVKRLVELHGGTVRVTSDGPGRGSCFIISLPASEVSPAPPPALADDTGEHRPVDAALRVLVVDDNVDAADTLSDALSAAGYRTEVAYDGPSALAAAAAMRPEVAILDIGLPVMDGYELARRLRASQGTAPLRLIAVTGYGQPQDRERTAEAGFDAHLVKPVGLRELLASIIG